MAIRRRYYHKFNSRSGDKYKITIWDLDHQSSTSDQSQTWGWQSSSDDDAKEIDIVYDSVEIKWDGDNQKLHQPILGSMLTFSMLATTDDHMGLVKALKHSTEFRVGVKVERFNFTSDAYEPYWYGVILPEAVVYDYSDLPCKIDIQATDGLSTLRDKPYINTDENLYDGHQPAQLQIGNCFKHLPHLVLWGEQDNFFFECVDLFHQSHATLDSNNDITSISSILNNVGCNVDIWYEKRDTDPPFFRDTDIRTTGASCYDVISNWMVSMGLRLCHVNGAFLAVSPFADKENINSRLYKYDKRTMVDPNFQFSDAVLQDANTALLPDTLDLRNNSHILTGSTRSFLHPLRSIYYKHLQGGAARLFPEVKWVNVEGDFAQDDINVNLLGQQFEISQNYNVSFPLDASQAIVPTEIGLRMVGILQHWYRPADTTNEDLAIGAQFEVRMMIKVGSYYLKQTVGVESSDIDYSTGFGDITKTGADITSWKPLVITSDVEWTTNSADRFSFPAFLKGQTTPDIDMLQYDAGDGTILEYYPGFGCRRHPSKPNEQKHDSTSRGMWKQAYETELDFTLPELPNANVSEQGVEITVEIIKYKNDTTTTTTTADVYPTNPIRPNGARIIGFNMYVGDGTDDGDAFYYAELDEPNGREMVVGGETLVASRVVADYGEIGAITANTQYTHQWHSENNFVYNSGRRNLQVLAEEHIRIRGEARDMYNLRFLIEEENTAFVHPLHTIQFQHENDFLLLRPLSMSYALSEAVLSVEAFQTGRNGGIITEVNDANKSKGGVGTNGVGGLGISGTRPDNVVRATFGSSDPGITADQSTKLAGIASGATANATNEQLRDRSTHTGTQVSTTISDFASAVTAVQAVADTAAKVVPLTLNAGGTAFTSVGIEQDAIRADKLLTSTDHQFITQTQLNAIASNTVTISSHTSSLSDIDDKVDLIAITAQHNLDTTKDKVGHIQIDGSNGITGFTVKTGSTPLTADEVSTSGTTNKFVTQAQKNKVDNLTVTSATNLDTHRQKLSYIGVTSQGINSFTLIGQPIDADKIDDSSSDNKFTNAAGVQAIGFLSSDANGITSITVSDSVDVDLDDAGAFFAGSSGETASRGGVTGNRVLLIDSNGGMDEVADGTAGQFLQTDGSGSYSFADAGGNGGWHGSTSLIKVLPTEFMGNDVGRSIVLTRIEEDTANTLGVQINQSTGKIFAFNEIPTGYKATHVHVYTSSAVTNGVTVLHYNTTTGATSNSTTGNTNVNIDITDLTSSTTNALVIEVTPGATNVFTYSAHITITSV